MISFCPLAKLSCRVDFNPFLPVCLVLRYLIADFLKGSQPKLIRLEFGLLVRQFNLAFLNCFRLLVWVSLMA